MKYILTMLMLVSIKIFAQGLRVPGQVLDMNKNPIENATITLVGVNSSSVTDVLGIFSLELPTSIGKGNIITLRISKEGYHTITRHISVSPLIIVFNMIKIKGFKSQMSSSNKISVPQASSTIYQPSNNLANGDQHIVSGFGNTVGINGNVNINQEKRLTERGQVDLLGKIEFIKTKYNFSPNCFNILLTTNSNGGKMAEDITYFLQQKGYKWVGSATLVINGIVKGVSV